MKRMISFFSVVGPLPKFSQFLNLKNTRENGFELYFTKFTDNQARLTQIIAYCLMPTHFHLIVKQLRNNGVSSHLSNSLNSYTRYFNTKHKRRGPLWEGRFKNVPVKSDEQLLHLTRYLHLNPVTASLVDRPQDWKYSSYKEYLSISHSSENLCSYNNLLEVQSNEYKKFVDDQISYQRELAKIRKLTLE